MNSNYEEAYAEVYVSEVKLRTDLKHKNKTIFEDDMKLDEMQYISKYHSLIVRKGLTEEYLTKRWQWMHDLATWENVLETYMKTPSAKSLKK